MNHLLPFTDPSAADAKAPLEIVSGDGIRVFDRQGKAYIDAVSALWCSPLGFTPERLTSAMTDQMAKLAYYHSFMGRTPEITTRLTARLASLLPGDLNHLFFTTSGSEAVETAANSPATIRMRGRPTKNALSREMALSWIRAGQRGADRLRLLP